MSSSSASDSSAHAHGKGPARPDSPASRAPPTQESPTTKRRRLTEILCADDWDWYPAKVTTMVEKEKVPDYVGPDYPILPALPCPVERVIAALVNGLSRLQYERLEVNADISKLTQQQSETNHRMDFQRHICDMRSEEHHKLVFKMENLEGIVQTFADRVLDLTNELNIARNRIQDLEARLAPPEEPEEDPEEEDPEEADPEEEDPEEEDPEEEPEEEEAHSEISSEVMPSDDEN